MFRIMSIATLVMIAVCFFVGVSLAFADELPATAPQATEQVNDASRPVETTFEENLAAGTTQADEYDFSDYLKGAATSTPAIDAERVEEPELDRMETFSI